MLSKTKIKVAQKVLTAISKDKRVKQIDAYVEMFENCREQGYRVITFDGPVKTIAFSENRNSDDIVVYHSPQYEEGQYSDQFWDNRKYFRYDEVAKAVDYIFELLGVR